MLVVSWTVVDGSTLHTPPSEGGREEYRGVGEGGFIGEAFAATG